MFNHKYLFYYLLFGKFEIKKILFFNELLANLE